MTAARHNTVFKTLASDRSLWWLPGLLSLLVISAIVFAPAVALLRNINSAVLLDPFTDPWLQRVIIFSFYQAFLSTAFSVVLAMPLAHILARRRQFPGRSQLLALFTLAFIIPTIVAVFGIVAIYGSNGWINQLWQALSPLFSSAGDSGTGLAENRSLIGSIYGLPGILLAHVFFNLPFATRVFLQSIEAIPVHDRKLAAQLGMTRLQSMRLLEWPAIRPQVAGIALLIFTLCFTSFAIVLTLGGGPRATTIEVAIYQALRFDFDLGAAVALALVQFTCCAVLVFLARRHSAADITISSYSNSEASEPSSQAITSRNTSINILQATNYQADSFFARLFDYGFIAIALSFVIFPMLALLVFAIKPALITVISAPLTLQATFNSIWVALASGILCISLSTGILLTSRHLDLRLGYPAIATTLQTSGLLILVIPPLVLGTGLFLLLRNFADVFSLALLLVVLINAVMGLPFAIRILSVPLWRTARRYDALADSLAINTVNRAKIVEWPLLKKPMAFAMAVTTTLSAGDLTAIALFGSERVVTLPLLLYSRMGSYRMYEAAGTALVLLIVCLLLFWSIERQGH